MAVAKSVIITSVFMCIYITWEDFVSTGMYEKIFATIYLYNRNKFVKKKYVSIYYLCVNINEPKLNYRLSRKKIQFCILIKKKKPRSNTTSTAPIRMLNCK